MTPISLAEFSARLLAEYEFPLRAPATRQKMTQVLAALARLPGVRTTADLDRPMVAGFIAARGPDANPNTTVGLLGYLRAACAYAASEGLSGPSPFDSKPVRRWLRRGPAARVTHHAPADVARFLDHLRSRAASGDWRARRLSALASVAALAGLRRNEALHLQRQDVDTAGRILVVSDRRRQKTEASAAPVPLCDELAAVLADWLPSAGPVWVFPGARGLGPWTGGIAGTKPLDRLKAAGREVGIQGMTFQSLRHSCATLLESQGVPELVIQRVLRHTSPRTTARYRHADPVSLVAWVRSVSYRRAG